MERKLRIARQSIWPVERAGQALDCLVERKVHVCRLAHEDLFWQIDTEVQAAFGRGHNITCCNQPEKDPGQQCHIGRNECRGQCQHQGGKPKHQQSAGWTDQWGASIWLRMFSRTVAASRPSISAVGPKTILWPQRWHIEPFDIVRNGIVATVEGGSRPCCARQCIGGSGGGTMCNLGAVPAWRVPALECKTGCHLPE